MFLNRKLLVSPSELSPTAVTAPLEATLVALKAPTDASLSEVLPAPSTTSSGGAS